MDPRVEPEDDEGGEITVTHSRPKINGAPLAFVILGLDPRIHATTGAVWRDDAMLHRRPVALAAQTRIG